MQNDTAEIVVVGAGAAGLCVAWAAAQRGLTPLLLEKSEQVGGAWAQFPASMRCLSPRQRDQMPDGSLPGGTGVRANAAEVNQMIQAFAASQNFEIRFGVIATGLSSDDSAIHLQTNQGIIDTQRLVVATGEYGSPHVPMLASNYRGKVEHTAVFDPESIQAGERVVVVGGGNSSVETVAALLERDAQVTLSLRSPVQRPIGGPAGPGFVESLTWWLSGLSVRWLPNRGGCKHQTPVVDSEIFNAVRDGRVTVVGEALCFEEDGVRVAGDTVVSCDRVVLATGYRRDIAWAADALTIGDTGVPAQRGGLSTDIKGLAFIGIPCMRTRRSGFIRGFTGDAQAIVAGLL